MLYKLRKIEIKFFRQYDLSNINQDLKFEEKKSLIAEDMKNFAIPRKLILF
jgi:hypothetical protein